MALGCACAAPALREIGNAASFGRVGTPAWGAAPGSLVTVRGEGLGPPDPVIATGYPAPAELGETKVQVTVGSQTLAAFPVSVSAREVTFALSSQTRTGDALVRVTYRGETSPPLAFVISPRSPGLFTANGQGRGPAEAWIESEGERISLTLVKPARPGQTVTVHGTGFGAVEGGEDGASRPTASLAGGVQIFAGKQSLEIVSISRAACCPGTDEIVFKAPSGVEGCYVPIVAWIPNGLDGRVFGQNQAVSNVATIAVSADGTACADPLGLGGEDLARLSLMEQPKMAALVLGRTFSATDVGPDPPGQDAAVARFDTTSGLSLLRASGIYGLPAPGTCIGYPYDTRAEAVPLASRGSALDAGAELTVSGPNGSAVLARRDDGSYTGASKKGFYAPGTYTIANGNGGADVPAFSAAISAPAPVTWTNKSHANPTARFGVVRVDWEGGEPGGYVMLFSMVQNAVASVYGVCTERAEARTFTMPSYEPYTLPIERRDLGGLPAIIGFGSIDARRFEATGIDFGVAAFASLDAFFSP
ncbi:MAG: hypothetical protein U0Q16_19030 [Bryobacteraceae bacterium]